MSGIDLEAIDYSEEWLDLIQIAKALRCDTSLLCNLARKGEFPEIVVLTPRRRRVRKADFEEFLKRVAISPESEARIKRDHDLGPREQYRRPEAERGQIERVRRHHANAS